MFDLASRVAKRIQLTTDSHSAYPKVITDGFFGDVDAMLIKPYGDATGTKDHERK